MDLSDWLIAAGVVLMLIIAADGIRRMRNRSKLRLKIDKEFENLPDVDLSAELPNGGARTAESASGVEANGTADEEIDLLMDDRFKGVSTGFSETVSKKGNSDSALFSEKPPSILSPKTTAHFKYQQPQSEVQSTKKSTVGDAVALGPAAENNRIEPSFTDEDIDLLNDPSIELEGTSVERETIENESLEANATNTTVETDAADMSINDIEDSSRFSNNDDEIIGSVRVREVVSTVKESRVSSDSIDLSARVLEPSLSIVDERPAAVSKEEYDFNKPITELMGDRIPAPPSAELGDVKAEGASVPADFSEKPESSDDFSLGTAADSELEEALPEKSVEQTESAPLVAETRSLDVDVKPKIKKKPKRKKNSRIQRWKEEIQTSFFDIDPGLDPLQQKEQDNKVEEKPEKPSSPASTKKPASSGDDTESKVLALTVTARERFSGVSLFKLVEACGMDFGEMDIFHRFESDQGEGAIQFSMVNGVKPGHFDITQRESFTTPAVSFFLQMGEPENLMNAFDCMLATAQCLADNLNGDVKDENHSVMRPQTIEHYRQQIRDFERRRLTRRA